jgi:hypothetical protein
MYIDGLLSHGITTKDRIFGYSSSSQKHTVFICFTKKYRDSTMAPLPASETVLDDEGNAPSVRDRGKLLANRHRMAILHALLSHTKNSNSKLQHGAVGLVAKQFKVSRVTVSNIWKRGRQSVEDGGSGAMVVLHRKKNCGRKLKDYSQQIANMTNIPLDERTCYRNTSAMQRPHSMVKKDGAICCHSSTVKPVLTDASKQFRIQYALNNINLDRRLFDSMMDVVHIRARF